jgi:hypothetical protein
MIADIESSKKNYFSKGKLIKASEACSLSILFGEVQVMPTFFLPESVVESIIVC